MEPVTSIDVPAEPATASLDPLFRLLQSDLESVNRLIVERMHSPVALIPQLAGHIVSAGGKRLRPLLTLASARLCGYRGERHVALAAAVEFIHTATLLHDDVVDASDLRRGRDTANAVWGNKPAVLVGDFLFSRVVRADGRGRLAAHPGDPVAGLRGHCRGRGRPAGDRQRHLDDRGGLSRSHRGEDRGAVCRRQPDRRHHRRAPGRSRRSALERYGRNLGIAFQLIDDMLDFSARQSELGKSVGDDFRDGKITLPILIAIARGDPEERDFWRRTLEDEDQGPGDLERAMRLVERRGALAETLARARVYAGEAIQALNIFPDGGLRRALVEAATFATDPRLLTPVAPPPHFPYISRPVGGV